MASVDLVLKDAKREPVFLSILLSGPSGSGKTYTALRLASGLAGKRPVVLIDTEVKPATLYADEFHFIRIALPRPYTPERYREAMKLAMTKNPGAVIVDSATHEWWGKGGILQTLDEMPGTNNMLKWKDLTPRHDRFTETLVSQHCHTIVCCRGKERYVMEETKRDDGTKKTEVKRVGTRPIQRRDFFFDYMLSFVLDPGTNAARILNNTTKTFRDYTPRILTEKDGEALARWAADGSSSKSSGGKKK